jgi:hypothetical protein
MCLSSLSDSQPGVWDSGVLAVGTVPYVAFIAGMFVTNDQEGIWEEVSWPDVSEVLSGEAGENHVSRQSAQPVCRTCHI